MGAGHGGRSAGRRSCHRGSVTCRRTLLRRSYYLPRHAVPSSRAPATPRKSCGCRCRRTVDARRFDVACSGVMGVGVGVCWGVATACHHRRPQRSPNPGCTPSDRVPPSASHQQIDKMQAGGMSCIQDRAWGMMARGGDLVPSGSSPPARLGSLRPASSPRSQAKTLGAKIFGDTVTPHCAVVDAGRRCFAPRRHSEVVCVR